MRTLFFFATAIVLYGCSINSELQKEFGVSENNIGSSCRGEIWISNEADEKTCIVRSTINPDRYLIYQDPEEVWSDKVLTVLTLGIYYFYNDAVDDTLQRWEKAADQYMRKHYDADALLVVFRKVEGVNGYGFAYTFKVLGGNQTHSDTESKKSKAVETVVLDTPISEN